MVGEGFRAGGEDFRRDHFHRGRGLVGEDVVDALAGVLGRVGVIHP